MLRSGSGRSLTRIPLMTPPTDAVVAASGELRSAVTSTVSAPPAILKAVSGKTWRFAPGNPLRVSTLTLKLDGPQASYEYEADTSQPGTMAGKFGGPVGFDGRYAVGGRLPSGPSAARAAWSADGTSLVVEVQTPGNDDVLRATHVFGDRTVEISVEGANGRRAKAQGRADD